MLNMSSAPTFLRLSFKGKPDTSRVVAAVGDWAEGRRVLGSSPRAAKA